MTLLVSLCNKMHGQGKTLAHSGFGQILRADPKIMRQK